MMKLVHSLGILLVLLVGAVQLASGLSGTSPVTILDGKATSPGARDLFFYRNVGTGGVGEAWYAGGVVGAVSVATGTSYSGDAFAHRLLAFPYYATRQTAIDKVSFRVTAIATAGNMRYGIYNNTSETVLLPSTVLWDDGVAVPVTATGVKTCPGIASCTSPASPQITLLANTLYWFVVMLDCPAAGLPTTTGVTCSGTAQTAVSLGVFASSQLGTLGMSTTLLVNNTGIESPKVATGSACCSNVLPTWPSGTQTLISSQPVAVAVHVSS